MKHRPGPQVTRVIAISVDGLLPSALRVRGAAVLDLMVEDGVSTNNARTARELTTGLPNHTSMLTGRRIIAGRSGHGVTWSDGRRLPATVQEAAGQDVASVFSVLESHARSAAMFASAHKLSLFKRSWPAGIDRFVVREHGGRLTRAVMADLRHHKRALVFVQFSGPDIAGHRHGFMSRAYFDAVRRVARRIARIRSWIVADEQRASHTLFIVTTDHGGRGRGHDDPARPANHRIPFIVWGRATASGEDLYDMAPPSYRDPGNWRTGYRDNRQPVRNGDLANLVTDFLRLPPVPGSEIGRPPVNIN